MKEAAGETNVTVITIVLIGIVAAIATPLITTLMTNTKTKSCCTNAGGTWSANRCNAGGNTGYSSAEFTSCTAR
jgi:hypothetical protein